MSHIRIIDDDQPIKGVGRQESEAPPPPPKKPRKKFFNQ